MVIIWANKIANGSSKLRTIDEIKSFQWLFGVITAVAVFTLSKTFPFAIIQ